MQKSKKETYLKKYIKKNIFRVSVVASLALICFILPSIATGCAANQAESFIRITTNKSVTTDNKNTVLSTSPTNTTEATMPNVTTNTITPNAAETAKARSFSNSTPAVSDIERQVVTLVNQARRERGLGELTLNEEVSGVARTKATDMANNNYFSHTSPTYGSPFDMLRQFGISYRTAGENIAKGQTSAQQVFDSWMNSEGHRANILNSSFTQIGVGYNANGNYWVQLFIG